MCPARSKSGLIRKAGKSNSASCNLCPGKQRLRAARVLRPDGQGNRGLVGNPHRVTCCVTKSFRAEDVEPAADLFSLARPARSWYWYGMPCSAKAASVSLAKKKKKRPPLFPHPCPSWRDGSGSVPASQGKVPREKAGANLGCWSRSISREAEGRRAPSTTAPS